MEALADMIGDQAKGLAVESKCDSCLMILETWSKNSIDHIMTQLKQLQVPFLLFFFLSSQDIFLLFSIFYSFHGILCCSGRYILSISLFNYDPFPLFTL